MECWSVGWICIDPWLQYSITPIREFMNDILNKATVLVLNRNWQAINIRNTHGIPDARNQYVKAVAEMSFMDYYVRGSGKKFGWRDVLNSLPAGSGPVANEIVP